MGTYYLKLKQKIRYQTAHIETEVDDMTTYVDIMSTKCQRPVDICRHLLTFRRPSQQTDVNSMSISIGISREVLYNFFLTRNLPEKLLGKY